MTNTSLNLLNIIEENHSMQTLVEKPCRISKVHSPYLVDVEFFDQNKSDILCNVPVKYLQTKRAYIVLGLKVGDRGTLKFFDNDSVNYLKGQDLESTELRKHDINDKYMSIGFYPEPEQYIFPNTDIAIGTTAGAFITINNKDLAATAENTTIDSENIQITASEITTNSTSITRNASEIINNSTGTIVNTANDISDTATNLTSTAETIIISAAGDISITGGTITVSGSRILINGNTEIDGKIFLEHKHLNGNNGEPTGIVM